MPTKVVVCDTPDGLAQLQYVLIKSGAALEIETVTDGLRAVEVSARTRPELVVAGIEAESLSGAELVRRLLAVSPETKVICWADASPLVAAEMLQAGAAAYVSKDDGAEEVFRAMRAVHAGPVALSPDVAADIATRLLEESNRVETPFILRSKRFHGHRPRLLLNSRNVCRLLEIGTRTATRLPATISAKSYGAGCKRRRSPTRVASAARPNAQGFPLWLKTATLRRRPSSTARHHGPDPYHLRRPWPEPTGAAPPNSCAISKRPIWPTSSNSSSRKSASS